MKDYLKDDLIKKMFEINGIYIEKKAITLGSNKPDISSSIENGYLITFVKDQNGKMIEETRNKLTNDVVIARNPEPVGYKDGKNIYNEWLVPKDIWLKNYGKETTNKFEAYQKIGSIKSLKIDKKVLELLNSRDGETAKISVDWNDEGMTVYKGGVLTDKGYGIAPDELELTYKEVKKSI